MLVLLIVLIAAVVLLGCADGVALDRVRPSKVHPGTAVACWLGALRGTVAAVAGVIAVGLLWPPTPGHEVVEWLRGGAAVHRGRDRRRKTGRLLLRPAATHVT
ncbi:hypothetical protein ACQP1W_25925 [Spirillospora sp. CA-255316]